MTRFNVAWRVVFVSAAALLLLVPLHDTRIASPQAEYDRARQLFVHGQLEVCQRLAERGYASSPSSDPSLAAKFRLLEAEVLLRRGLTNESLRLLDSSHTPSASEQDQIRSLVIESVALTRQNRLDLADKRLALAEALCKNVETVECGEAWRSRGDIAAGQDKDDDALPAYFKALQVARSAHDRYLEATAELDIGWFDLQIEHFDESIDWSRKAYQIASEVGAEDLAENISGNLGWAYFDLGDPERALDLFVEAEKRAEKLGNIRTQVRWLTTSGNVYWNSEDLPRANDSFRRALALARRIDSKEDIVNTLEDLAHESIDAGKLGDANGYLQELGPELNANGKRLDALDVTFAQARIASATHNDKDAEALFKVVEKDPASQTSMKLGAEHELARLYESDGRVADADRLYQTALNTFEAARSEIKDEDSKLPFLANATGVYDDYIHFLVSNHRTDEALALADRSRARTLEQGLGVSSGKAALSRASSHPQEIARRTKATLLFYWLGKRESFLWAISPAKASMFTLPPRDRIAKLVERYRKTLLGLRDPIETSNPDGVALYRMLVEPARDMIRPGAMAVILNDGILSQLNFETLIAPDPAPHYFIEDATLISASSLDLLASAKPLERSGNKLLLVGNAVSPNPDYPNLPEAATEMHQIEQHFAASDVTSFEKERATAGSYLRGAPQQYTYIHFVAHGVASRLEPLDSAIILSRSTADPDSFKLHAREIMQHPINARLVTISACYGSGTRSYAGEGLVGLAWAFLRAGAHHVIGALWEVNEESTPRLMGSLYQGLESGQSPAESLRQAKLALLHSKGEFRKPFFWAPLQIYTGV